MTRKTIKGMIDELKAFTKIDDLAEYKRAKELFLEKAVPLCIQSKKTMHIAGFMKEMLAVVLYIPAKNEAGTREIMEREREALADIKKRIVGLESLLRDTMKVEISHIALALMFLTCGILALVLVGGRIGSAAASADWPSVEGRLAKIGLSERKSSTYAGRIGTRTESVSYGIDVEYDYRVSGRTYRGQQFSFEPRSGDREYWEAKTRKFKTGSPVSVYYDPSNPESSVLETGAYEWNYIFIAMGLAFTGAGLYFTARIVKFQFF